MSRLGRATIALYNSYDPTKFREAHRRALARAGPLALAFDLNLATFGFPFPAELQTPREIADWVATTTSIGEHGGFLQKLTGERAFSDVPLSQSRLPSPAGRGDPDHQQARGGSEGRYGRRRGRPTLWPKRARGLRPWAKGSSQGSVRDVPYASGHHSWRLLPGDLHGHGGRGRRHCA